MDVLAICEPAAGGARVAGVVIPLALVAAWAVVALVVWRAAPRDGRVRIAVAFAIGVAAGAVAVYYPDGLSDADTDYLGQFLVAVVAAGVAGLAISFVPPGVAHLRTTVSGLLGTAVVPGGLVGLFIFALSISGTCID